MPDTFSTSWHRLPDGGTLLIVATVERGEIFRMALSPEETIDNLRAWASVHDLSVAVVL